MDTSSRGVPMDDLRTFTEWLSFHPSCDEISRALVTDYLAPLGACSARIGRLGNDDSLTFLGEYGFDPGREGKTFSSSEWRSWRHDAALIALGLNAGPWNQESDLIMIQLRDRGAVHGFLVVKFSAPVKERECVEESVRNYAVAVALFLSFQNSHSIHPTPSSGNERAVGSMTARQLAILKGMVEGKTNHELANELGFSVSTIRHETMRIYEALSVSDRKEAARKALNLALI